MNDDDPAPPGGGTTAEELELGDRAAVVRKAEGLFAEAVARGDLEQAVRYGRLVECLLGEPDR
jgi:hypothetical protein